MSTTITEPTMVPVWRALSPYVIDDTWFVSPLAGMRSTSRPGCAARRGRSSRVDR